MARDLVTSFEFVLLEQADVLGVPPLKRNLTRALRLPLVASRPAAGQHDLLVAVLLHVEEGLQQVERVKLPS